MAECARAVLRAASVPGGTMSIVTGNEHRRGEDAPRTCVDGAKPERRCETDVTPGGERAAAVAVELGDAALARVVVEAALLGAAVQSLDGRNHHGGFIGWQREIPCQLLQEGHLISIDNSVGMNEMRSHGQRRLLLAKTQLWDCIADQTLNALFPQHQEKAIKQIAHGGFGTVAVKRAILQLAAESMRFIPSELSITGHCSKGDRCESFSSVHGSDDPLHI